MEHIVAAQIRSHVGSNDLRNTFQSAHKAGHSMKTGLLCIQNEIHLSLSKGMPMVLVRLDLLAPIATIDYDTFPSYLSTSFGFTGTAIRWFTTYLLDRFQSVKIGSVIRMFQTKFWGTSGLYSWSFVLCCSPYTLPPLARKLQNI